MVIDIKTAWNGESGGGGGRKSFSQARRKSKKMCKFGQHFEVAFTKVDMHFCGLPHKAFTGTLTHQGKMVEKRVQRRGLLCSAQVSHNPTLPITPPFDSFPGSQDELGTEAGSLPLAGTNLVPQF